MSERRAPNLDPVLRGDRGLMLEPCIGENTVDRQFGSFPLQHSEHSHRVFSTGVAYYERNIARIPPREFANLS